MTVALYIETESYGNATNKVVSDFEQRVLLDGGTFESGTCLINQVNALGGTFGNVVSYKRLELFDDEKISVTSSIQNINDISKVFTDYSQTFSVPASEVNNDILKHWYENSVDNGFNQNVNQNGYIEIDTQIFRFGRWQLSGSSIKDGYIESYKLTFFGNLKSLLDKFGEDLLKDVEQLNDYSIAYTGDAVKNTITTTDDLDVHFPLISSLRLWELSGGGTNNINSTGHPMLNNELFPALKLYRMFQAIEDKYGVFFSGQFLTQSRFTQAYQYFKNKDVFSNLGNETVADLTSFSSSGVFYPIEADLTLNQWTFTFDSSSYLVGWAHSFNITFSATTNYTVNVYKDGVFYTNFVGNSNSISSSLGIDTATYYLTIQTENSVTYSLSIVGNVSEYDPGSGTFPSSSTILGSGTTTNILSLTSLAPNIKVSDWFSGVLKMFNLTAFSTDGINFTLEQLENWYYQGEIKDFSEYTQNDIELERVKPYKKIMLEYQKSNSLINNAFFENAARDYGNLTYELNNDGSDYSVKLPFENLLFSKYTSTDFQVGFCVDKDLKPYIPKPIILYKYGQADCQFKFNNGSTTTDITTYNVFGQDVSYLNENHTLNFGLENSSYLNEVVTNTLFSNYYLDYLKNLYEIKSRLVKVKMRLPYLELLNLKLNDRIVIRDKRYIINQYTTDLTTFESDFELLQDFRAVEFNNSFFIQTDSLAKILSFPIVGNKEFSVLEDASGVIRDFEIVDNYLNVDVTENLGTDKIASLTDGYSVILIEQAEA